MAISNGKTIFVDLNKGTYTVYRLEPVIQGTYPLDNSEAYYLEDNLCDKLDADIVQVTGVNGKFALVEHRNGLRNEADELHR